MNLCIKPIMTYLIDLDGPSDNHAIWMWIDPDRVFSIGLQIIIMFAIHVE